MHHLLTPICNIYFFIITTLFAELLKASRAVGVVVVSLEVARVKLLFASLTSEAGERNKKKKRKNVKM